MKGYFDNWGHEGERDGIYNFIYMLVSSMSILYNNTLLCLLTQNYYCTLYLYTFYITSTLSEQVYMHVENYYAIYICIYTYMYIHA